MHAGVRLGPPARPDREAARGGHGAEPGHHRGDGGGEDRRRQRHPGQLAGTETERPEDGQTRPFAAAEPELHRPQHEQGSQGEHGGEGVQRPDVG